MKISELLSKYLPEYGFVVENEKEFDTFSLVASDIPQRNCTFLDRVDLIDKIPSQVSMVITNELIGERLKASGRGVCIVDNPRVVFFKLHNAISKVEPYARSRYKTTIGKGCTIHPTSIISEKNVTIGDNVLIEEHVVIKENVTIGDNSKIRAGVKIGGWDFEFKREGDTVFGVDHCGGVKIGKEVEISYNSVANKALYPWDDTIIGDYCKIDMLVSVSHGVKIGSETMVVGNSGIGGRTIIGKKSWIGFGCIVRNGITIGDNARVNMGAVVSRDVGDNMEVTGNFAIDHELFMKNLKDSVKKDG